MRSFLFGGETTSMLKPVALAKNSAGLLAVADPGIPTVHFFQLIGRRYWRLEEDLRLRIRSPVGVVVDDSGRVYVADSLANRVFVFDRGRDLIGEIGVGVLGRPTGLALSPAQDRLYVVDTGDCRIVIFDLKGRKLDEFGRRGGAPGEFNAPTYITVAPGGSLAVSDSLNFRVQTFESDGSPKAVFGEPGDGAGSFARPKGIAVDSGGRLYVVDAAFENVQIFEPDGTLLLAFGGPGTENGEFVLPTGLFLDSTDTIWMADSFNKRVQIFRLLTPE
jgi:DNA-binding beta-propeller fold protein YncE